jgi:CheY-like chemotaxis protein
MVKDTKPGDAVVLLVEDDATVLTLFSHGLQQAGFHVMTAHSANDALQRVKELGHIDVLATDLILTDHLRLAKHASQRPARHGLELMRLMLKVYPNLKVVLFSGQSNDMVNGMGGIPDGAVFLRKPFSADTLAWSIRQVLAIPIRPKCIQSNANHEVK